MTGIFSIMYTSRTTGEKKCVILTNGASIGEVQSMDELLPKTDKEVIFSYPSCLA